MLRCIGKNVILDSSDKNEYKKQTKLVEIYLEGIMDRGSTPLISTNKKALQC